MRGDIEKDENGQRSEFAASAISFAASPRIHAMDVDYVEGEEESVVRPRRVIIPRTPEDTAPLQRRRERQRTEAEDAQLESIHRSSEASAWHRVQSSTTWWHRDHWSRSWSQSSH